MDSPGPQPDRRRVAWRQVAAAGFVLVVTVGGCADVVDPPSAATPAAASARPVKSAAAEPAPPLTRRSTPPASPRPEEAIRHARPRSALALLGTLAVKGRAAKTGYDRSAFGAAWTDTNRNGCDTRDDILARDLTDRRVRPGTRGCVAVAGRLADAYTGQHIQFLYGGAPDVDIDHVVALGDAWQKGAFRWAARKRLAFANDPLNLMATSASANRSKGDGDDATWLPPNKSFRCAYVARQVAVKAKYGLWVTVAERAASARILTRCPQRVAPTGTAPTISPVAGSTRQASPTPTPASKPGHGGASAVCRDSTPSYSAHRRGTCSQHGGVRRWLKDLPA